MKWDQGNLLVVVEPKIGTNENEIEELEGQKEHKILSNEQITNGDVEVLRMTIKTSSCRVVVGSDNIFTFIILIKMGKGKEVGERTTRSRWDW